MKRCVHCVLPETFPGIQFDEDGLCQYCRRMPRAEKRVEQRARLRERFEKLVAEVRPEPGYHCLMSWSGGKDSTYTLWLLRHTYDLRVLAFTFDNGFISPVAIDNMRTVAAELGVDHVIIKPHFDLLRELFAASVGPAMYPPKVLKRASGICNTCMGLAKGIALRLALEKRLPMMVYGWSPGQIPLASAFMRGNRTMLQAMAEAAKKPLVEVGGQQVEVYFPEARHFQTVPRMPVNVSPLIFTEWDEATAVRTIEAYGWRRPEDTDPNSSNCLLNCLAIRVHIRQWGYHPYVMELAGLVREGYMSREEALRRLREDSPEDMVAVVADKLGVSLSVDKTSAAPGALRMDT